jgi:hypothetical protein
MFQAMVPYMQEEQEISYKKGGDVYALRGNINSIGNRGIGISGTQLQQIC